jgi:hypothetical protein
VRRPGAGKARSGACRRAFAAATLLATATLAHALIIDLEWTPAGSFERQISIAPGQFAELCGALAKGQSVQWTFEAGTALDFNIHYHQGNDVVYPARASDAARADGTLQVDRAQDYCWMWTNKSGRPTSLKVQLRRQ